MPNRARPRSRGLLSAWAGDSPWRRFVAGLAQSAILAAVVAIGGAIIWFVLTPWMIDGMTKVMAR